MTQKYKLTVVLKLRERLKDEAAHNARRKQEKLREAEAELENRLEKVRDCQNHQAEVKNRIANDKVNRVNAHLVTTYKIFLDDLHRQELDLSRFAEKQKTVLADSAAATEKAMQELVEATKEVHIIEKHREKWRQQMKVEDARREQARLDEIAISYRKVDLSEV